MYHVYTKTQWLLTDLLLLKQLLSFAHFPPFSLIGVIISKIQIFFRFMLSLKTLSKIQKFKNYKIPKLGNCKLYQKFDVTQLISQQFSRRDFEPVTFIVINQKQISHQVKRFNKLLKFWAGIKVKKIWNENQLKCISVKKD